MPDSETLSQAALVMARQMNLSSEADILSKLAIHDYHEGEIITAQNDARHINHLYYIVSGESLRDI